MYIDNNKNNDKVHVIRDSDIAISKRCGHCLHQNLRNDMNKGSEE